MTFRLPSDLKIICPPGARGSAVPFWNAISFAEKVTRPIALAFALIGVQVSGGAAVCAIAAAGDANSSSRQTARVGRASASRKCRNATRHLLDRAIEQREDIALRRPRMVVEPDDALPCGKQHEPRPDRALRG